MSIRDGLWDIEKLVDLSYGGGTSKYDNLIMSRISNYLKMNKVLGKDVRLRVGTSYHIMPYTLDMGAVGAILLDCNIYAKDKIGIITEVNGKYCTTTNLWKTDITRQDVWNQNLKKKHRKEIENIVKEVYNIILRLKSELFEDMKEQKRRDKIEKQEFEKETINDVFG